MSNCELLPNIMLYAILLGITMKIADLLDEHGLKLFKGADILYGVLWGVFGSLLILSNNYLAIFMVVMLINFTLRYRLDYLNHGIAASIMWLVFLWNLPYFKMDWFLFLGNLVLFVICGLLNDAADKNIFRGNFAKIFELNLHYFYIPLIFVLIDLKFWPILAASSFYIISYETTKIIGEKYLKN